MKKDIVIFMPGLMGSKLAFTDKKKLNVVFPSSLVDIFQKRMNKNDFHQLTHNKKLVPFDIVRTSHGKNIYKSLIDFFKKLGYVEYNPNNVSHLDNKKTEKNKKTKQLYILPYDWRIEIQTHVHLLSELIKKIVKSHDARSIEITLVGHSLGGLIQRAYLESRNKPDVSDFYRLFVKKFIGIAVPHNGSYNAYKAITGTAESICLSKEQISVLANKPAFPILYQLLPSDLKNINQSELPNKDSLEQLNILQSYLNINKQLPSTKYYLISGVSVATPIGPATSEEKLNDLKNQYFKNNIQHAADYSDNDIMPEISTDSLNSSIISSLLPPPPPPLTNLENDITTKQNNSLLTSGVNNIDNKKRISLDNITFEKASSILYGGDEIKNKTTTNNDYLYKYDGDGCVQALSFNKFESANLYNIKTSTNHKYLFKSAAVLRRLKEILEK